MPLRVGFLNHVGSSIGGGERTLATFLAHRPDEIEAIVLLLEDGTFGDHLRSLGITVRIVPAAHALIDARRERFSLRAVLLLPAVVLRVASALRRERIDVLYTNSMKAHVIGGVAARLARVPCVMHFHDLIGGFGLWLLRTVARLGSVRRIACSGIVARRIGLSHTSVVYGPVDLDAFRSLPDRTEAGARIGIDGSLPTVSLIGRINRWKGHDRFVRIAALVAQRRPAQFAIVGSPIFRDQSFLPELEAMVDRLGLRDTVRFVPWVDDVRDVYAATDVNVNTSTREPLGRTPAEAAAAGIPSVVFDDSGAAEWMRGTANDAIVPAWDEAGFADKIVSLFDRAGSSERRREIAHTAERFDAERIARETTGVIREAARA